MGNEKHLPASTENYCCINCYLFRFFINKHINIDNFAAYQIVHTVCHILRK